MTCEWEIKQESLIEGTAVDVETFNFLFSNLISVLLGVSIPLSGSPGCSAGKESACNAGDSDWIPGSKRSPGEGIGYPLQYSSSSLVAQTVKNLPAMWETWLQSVGWEYPLEVVMTTHSSILAWRISMNSAAWQATVHGLANSRTWLSD